VRIHQSRHADADRAIPATVALRGHDLLGEQVERRGVFAAAVLDPAAQALAAVRVEDGDFDLRPADVDP
jgi:hypothetical protein